MNKDIIIIDLESNREAISIELYLGLRITEAAEYTSSALLNEGKEEKDKSFSMVGAEAYCLLKELEKSHPKLFKESKDWVDKNYSKEILQNLGTKS